MKLRIARVVAAAVLIEALSIAALVLVVALFGPPEAAAAEAYAIRLGAWVGPIAGFVLTLIGSWLVTRKLARGNVLNGVAVGVAVAIIDVALLIVGHTPFEILFVVSNVGRVAAGTLGGALTSRARRPIDKA